MTEPRLHAIKLVYDNGLIEDVKSGIIVTKDGDSLSFDILNLLPLDQLLVAAITFHQLHMEHLKDIESGMDELLSEFINALMQFQKQNKGDVLNELY